MGTVRFILREDKPDKQNLFPIELVYQISGQRKYFRPKEKLAAVNWSVTNQQAIYVDKAAAKKFHPKIDFKSLPYEQLYLDENRKDQKIQRGKGKVRFS